MLYITAILVAVCAYLAGSINTSIILSSNPDDGQFSVTSLDNAQKTRFINFNLKLNTEEWAKWAESAEIDGRA